jgi:hypothetical protein
MNMMFPLPLVTDTMSIRDEPLRAIDTGLTFFGKRLFLEDGTASDCKRLALRIQEDHPYVLPSKDWTNGFAP